MSLDVPRDFLLLPAKIFRGGRADFKWEDVKDDAQRENYLGHSLMARKS